MSLQTTLRWIGAYTTQFAAIIFLLMAANGVYSSFYANRESYRSEKTQTERERQKATEEIAARCNVLLDPTHTLRGCLARELEAYEKKANTDKDLEAQQDMAFWAQAVFWLTAIGAAISAFGIYFVWLSLRQTRQAISTDREVGHAQVRAYLTIESETPIISPGKVPLHEFQIKNTGQSPAYSVAYIAGFLVLPKPLPPGRRHLGSIAGGQEMPNMALGSNASMTVEGVGPDLLSHQEYSDVVAGRQGLYFFARVFYKDVFQQEHETSLVGVLDFKQLDGPEVNGMKPYRVSMQIDQTRSYAN